MLTDESQLYLLTDIIISFFIQSEVTNTNIRGLFHWKEFEMASFDSPTDDKTKVYFKCKAGYRLCADETTCILKDSICRKNEFLLIFI